MMYPDYKLRYAILGAAEIASSSDNKTAVYALMDTLLSSSRLALLPGLRRLVMKLSSSWSDTFRERSSRGSDSPLTPRGGIRENSSRGLRGLQEGQIPHLRQEEGSERTHQGGSEEFQKVCQHEGMGMVCHHPEDQTYDWPA